MFIDVINGRSQRVIYCKYSLLHCRAVSALIDNSYVEYVIYSQWLMFMRSISASLGAGPQVTMVCLLFISNNMDTDCSLPRLL